MLCIDLGGEFVLDPVTLDYLAATEHAARGLPGAATEQNLDQRKRRPKATGQPVLARRLGSTGAWTEYSSATAAAKALGVRGSHLSNMLSGKQKSACGYVLKWAEAREPQIDLPAEGAQPAERWESASDRLRISNRGRVQTMYPSGTNWGHRRTPVPRLDEAYARVHCRGKCRCVHQLVYDLFGEPALEPGATVDHIDRDTTNNSIDNLRAVTRSEPRQHASQNAPTPRNLVRAKPADGSSEWETFESQKGAARALNARFPDKRFNSSEISRVVRGMFERHHGWVFEAAS